MVTVINGDIINSRKLINQELWLKTLKKMLNEYGKTPKNWEIFRGDSFQLELKNPEEALFVALRIKALIKSTEIVKGNTRTTPIDVRIAIGIGEKDYDAKRVSESNGSAFINAGEKFKTLKKEKTTLAIQSPFPRFDAEMNLYLKLALIQMDSWSISSAELFTTILNHPDKIQTEIGTILGIEQSSVSGRFKRASVEEILAIEQMYRTKLKEIMP